VKSFVRTIFVNTFALWCTSQVITGFSINGGLDSILLAGFVFTLLLLIVKPILSLISMPIMLLTLGLFSWVISIFLLYVLTVFVSQVNIGAYAFAGLHVGSLTVSRFTLSPFQTAIAAAFMVSLSRQIIIWLFDL
jgi:putative membrane protein